MPTLTGKSAETGPGLAAERVVALGCRAPSVHNTQPWSWRINGPGIELYTDRTRQLRVSDPDGRNLTISCGAALHHARVAAAGLGWTTAVTRFPDPADPDLLAVIELGGREAPTDAQHELLDALERRQTDRRRFTSWPVPEERLGHLAEVAERWGARVLPLTGAAARATVERLISEAIDVQASDPAYLDEQRAWTGGAYADGVPDSSLPPQKHPSERRDRFERQADEATAAGVMTSSDQILALCTSGDEPLAWLDAGETLSALWLRATVAGLSLVPLSQVIEVEATRTALREQVFFGMAQPQLLARIGWLEITRPPLPRTPRRPFGDVFR